MKKHLVRNWKAWVIGAGITLLPAIAFAANHLATPGCTCPICSLLR